MYFWKKIVPKVLLVATFAMFTFAICRFSKEDIAVSALDVEQSYFEQIYISKNVDSLQKVKLFRGDRDVYYAFMPSDMLYDAQIYFDTFESLQIGEMNYQRGDVLTDVRGDSPYTMIAKDGQGEILEEGVVQFLYSIHVPSIYIETESGTFENINTQRNVNQILQRM